MKFTTVIELSGDFEEDFPTDYNKIEFLKEVLRCGADMCGFTGRVLDVDVIDEGE